MSTRHYVDLHIHSNFSDGQLTIPEIVDLYGKKGFSAIAITDHLADSRTLTGQVTRHLKLSLTQASIDPYLSTLKKEAVRAQEKYGMLLIPGVEITLNSWSRKKGAHLVFLGLNDFIDPNQSIENLLRLARQKKYFTIAAHPLWEKAFEFKTTYLWDQRENLKNDFDAWERATAKFFSKEVYLSQLPIISSSDFHGSTYFESWKSCTYTPNELAGAQHLYQLIRSRHIEPVWI